MKPLGVHAALLSCTLNDVTDLIEGVDEQKHEPQIFWGFYGFLLLSLEVTPYRTVR